MRAISSAFLIVIFVLTSPNAALAQSTQAGASVTVPRLINVTGVFQPVDGQAPAGVEVVTLSIYAEPDGGAPLWQERQSVAVDRTGRFTLLLGASDPNGIPAAVFGAGQAQWMSLLFERAGEVEQPRVRIASVPYALKASDAETLGGLPASAYLLAPTGAGTSATTGTHETLVTTPTDPPVTADVVQPGTTNFLAKYVNGALAELDDSAVYEAGGRVGIGTTAPVDALHLQFTDPNGATTGLAVRNLGNTATSYSGMLFYDQFGALAQFQGFNNVTHEYRINNIATNGSINFMLGTSRFFVGSNGNVGIGTTSPSASLDVSNAITGVGTGNIVGTAYTANSFSPLFLGRKARGTAAAPTAALSGDQLAFFGGMGYTGTTFAGSSGMRIAAAENWTNAAQGSAIQFQTTPLGSTTPINRMRLDPSGNLGIGTFAPSVAVEVVRETDDAILLATGYAGGGSAGSLLGTRTARGTQAAPTAVQMGDDLGFFVTSGYGATGWGEIGTGVGGIAAENWTDTAQGAALAFITTPIGTNDPDHASMVIAPDGNVGIGTFTAITTIPDKLQVFGDIRVGTTGTNGCLKNFAGTGIIGTCLSDRRYKKDITPFGSVLGPLTALQPVHYFWRAADFPQQQFGSDRTYGLIAQDVEQVLPELVVTNEDGFKAIDYSKLPLLTIQAVKELKAENDALKRRVAESEGLKRRVDELERLVKELVTAGARP